MDAELYNTDWLWFGKDRSGRRGGGLGFLARKTLKPHISGSCKNSNILWLDVDCFGSWFVAVVYLIPNDVENVNEMTLSDLQQDILVLGDFNSRVGVLPNVLMPMDSTEELVIARTSEDLTVRRLGRRVTAGVGMVLLNGVSEKAKNTSLQAKGNSVIDFIWVQREDLKLVRRRCRMKSLGGV